MRARSIAWGEHLIFFPVKHPCLLCCRRTISLHHSHGPDLARTFLASAVRFIVFPNSTAQYKIFSVIALFRDILITNWLPPTLCKVLFTTANAVSIPLNKSPPSTEALSEVPSRAWGYAPRPPLPHRRFLQHLILSSHTSSPTPFCLWADRTLSLRLSRLGGNSAGGCWTLEGVCLQPAHLLLVHM